MSIKTAQKAFTLIELIFYFTILSLILGAMISFSVQILSSGKKSDNLHELQSNMDYVTGRIISNIQMASGLDIVNSIFASDNGKLVLNVIESAKSPTSFYLQNGYAYMKQGANDPVKISSDSIRVTKFRFERGVTPKVPDQIIFYGTFEPVNKDFAELSTPLEIRASASLRK